MSRAELDARNLRNVLDSMEVYLHGGGSLPIQTRHGDAAEDNEIIFRLADWDAFVAALEPTGWRPPAADQGDRGTPDGSA